MAKIRRIGVLKMASFMGLYGIAMGLIFGIIFALLSFVMPSSIQQTGEPQVSLGMFKWFFGVGAIIFLPLFYGITMFISAIIFTPIMNLILKIVNGLDLEIEMMQQ